MSITLSLPSLLDPFSNFTFPPFSKREPICLAFTLYPYSTLNLPIRLFDNNGRYHQSVDSQDPQVHHWRREEGRSSTRWQEQQGEDGHGQDASFLQGAQGGVQESRLQGPAERAG